jgi:hypothetical protein
MYLLWQPPPLANTATPSYPVPIGHKDWNFVATAFQDDPVGYPPAGNDHWDKNTTLTPSGNETMSFEPAQPTDNALYGYPLWSGIVSNECGVSQAIDFNALHSYPLWNVLPNTDDDSNNKEKQ